MKKKFNHLNSNDEINMVNIDNKSNTKRTAIACANIRMQKTTFDQINKLRNPKGDIITTAKLAGIMAAKKTSDIIPLCHSIEITGIDISIEMNEKDHYIKIIAKTITTGKTGVEMESLTAASIAALTIYDMCKAIDKSMIIENIKLISKTGGNSGNYKSK